MDLLVIDKRYGVKIKIVRNVPHETIVYNIDKYLKRLFGLSDSDYDQDDFYWIANDKISIKDTYYEK